MCLWCCMVGTPTHGIEWSWPPTFEDEPLEKLESRLTYLNSTLFINFTDYSSRCHDDYSQVTDIVNELKKSLAAGRKLTDEQRQEFDNRLTVLDKKVLGNMSEFDKIKKDIFELQISMTKIKELENKINDNNKQSKEQINKEIEKNEEKMDTIVETLQQKITAEQKVELDNVKTTLNNGLEEQTQAQTQLKVEVSEKFETVHTQSLNIQSEVKETKAELLNLDKKHNQTKHTIQEDVNNLQIELEKSKHQTTDNFLEIKRSVKYFEDLNAKQRNEFEEQVAKNEEELQIVKSNLKKAWTDLNTLEDKYQKTMGVILNNKEEIDKNFNESKKEMGEIISELKGTLTDLQNQKNNIKQSIADTRESFKKTEEEIGVKIKDAENSLKKTIADADSDLTQKIEEMKSVIDVLYPNTFNKASLTVVVVIIVLFVFGNTIAIWILFRSNLHQTRSEPSHSSPVKQYCNPIINKIPLDQNLVHAVCVVSFDEEAQRHHKRLVASVTDTMSTDVHVFYHVIHNHQDIVTLPPTTLYLMFTEFTERHVIIEEQGIGLGDMKKTTTEAIMDRFGGCLAIIYVRDPGSNRMSPSSRYNKNIDCATSQPELAAINRQGLFYSVYETFTDYQIHSLQDVITRYK